MFNNVSGFECNINNERDEGYYHCYVKPDSSKNAAQVNYEVKDILRVVLETESFNLSNLTLSEFPFCERFKNLKILEINGNEETYLDENFLSQCEHMTDFRLEHMNLMEIPEFFLIKNQKLNKVKLNYLNLLTLLENFFLNQNKLEELNLSQNKIAFLPPNIFKSLTELKTLHLSWNSLKTLNSAWFESLGKLHELRLQGNEIKDLPKSVFKNLKNLEYLSLYRNQLTVVHSDSFGTHLKLQTLGLWWNEIDAIDEKLIDNLIVNQIDMSDGNICFNDYIEKREEIKPKLHKCFSNYRPRQVSLPWNFTHLTSDCNCGIRKVPRPLVHGGVDIYRGEFPWNAILKNNVSHFCGGTIISEKAVVTAAHCVKGKDYVPYFSPSDFSILLGAHDLSLENEPTRVTVWAKAIHIHPDWNVNRASYEADIAILEIDNDFKFSKYIQPICLPSPQSGVSNEAEGVVAGFGYMKNRILATIGQKLFIPIIDFHTCIDKSPDHESLLSARSICGGPGDGRGVCSGDSGSGLNAYKNKKIYLIGVVSVALITNVNECNVDSYAVYTSVADFYRWIMTGMRN